MLLRYGLIVPGLLLLLSGCGRKPAAAWKVVPSTGEQLLVPPRPGAPESLQTNSWTLQRARSKGKQSPECGISLRGFRLEWAGRNASIQADARELQPKPGVLVEATSPDGRIHHLPGVALERNWFQLLPGALERLVSTGCLSRNDARVLPSRIAAEMTLPPSLTWRLQSGDPANTGYIDLEPGYVLKTVTPVVEGGETAGYLTAYYTTSRARDGGVVVAAADAERNLRGILTNGKSPDHAVLHLPGEATRLRLFLRTWTIAQDRRIALVAAPTLDLLDQATKEFETDPESFCRAGASRGIACVAIPKDSVLHAEVAVTVNGKPVRLPAGSSLQQALEGGRIQRDMKLPAGLTIHRQWRGKPLPVVFEPAPEMLRFVLLNGDTVAFPAS